MLRRAALAVAVAALGACSSGERATVSDASLVSDASPATSSTASSESTASTATTPVGAAPSPPTSTATTIADVTEIEHTPAEGKFEGALKDVSDQKCERLADGWHVAGVVTNPTSKAADYRIYISLLNAESRTRALVETEVLGVEPDQTGEYERTIDLPDEVLNCFVRVERRVTR